MPEPRRRGLDQVLHDPAGKLGGLVAHARRLAELDMRLRPCLDPELAAHCRVAGFAAGRMVLAADTPAWATRLRYHTPQIREKLYATGLKVEECKVVVTPAPQPAPVRAGRPRPALGREAAAGLAAAADGIGHPPLAAALRRLSKNERGQNSDGVRPHSDD